MKNQQEEGAGAHQTGETGPSLWKLLTSAGWRRHLTMLVGTCMNTFWLLYLTRGMQETWKAHALGSMAILPGMLSVLFVSYWWRRSPPTSG